MFVVCCCLLLSVVLIQLADLKTKITAASGKKSAALSKATTALAEAASWDERLQNLKQIRTVLNKAREMSTPGKKEETDEEKALRLLETEKKKKSKQVKELKQRSKMISRTIELQDEQ